MNPLRVFSLVALVVVLGPSVLAQRVYVARPTGLADSPTNLVGVSASDGSHIVALGNGPAAALVSGVADGAWSVVPAPAGQRLGPLAFGSGRYLAAAGTNVLQLVEPDWTWTNGSPQGVFPGGVQIGGVAFNTNAAGAGTFVAVARGPSIRYSSEPFATWTAASIGSLNPFEDYRSVSAIHDGFAVCGGREVIRISRDAGRNWTVARAYQLSSTAATLLGIAEGSVSGKYVLVAVGEQGKILLSNDGGASWETRPSPTGTRRLTAVCHAGDEFVAVGDSGTILRSATGRDWESVPSAVTQNLTAVTAGRTGALAGVVIAVGDGGTVVIGSTKPEVSAKVSGSTTLEALGSVSAAIQVELSGIPPWTLVWSDGRSTTYDTNPAVREITLLGLPSDRAKVVTFSLQSARDAIGRASESNVTGQAVITVNPTVTAEVVTGAVTNQGPAGGSATQPVGVKLTGVAPWTVTWSDGSTNSYAASPATYDAVISGIPADRPTTTTLKVTAVEDSIGSKALPDALTGAATITVNPTVTGKILTEAVTLSGKAGDTVNLPMQVELTGVAPWTVTWSSGVTETYTNSPATYTAAVTNLAGGQATVSSFTLTAVKDSAGSEAATGALAGTATFTVRPVVTATVAAADLVVPGEAGGSVTNAVQVELTGVAPWTVTWSDGTSGTYAASPARFDAVIAGLAGDRATVVTYTVMAAKDSVGAEAVADDLRGSAKVTVNPVVTGKVLTSDSTLTGVAGGSVTNVIQVELTGVAPWTVAWSDGISETYSNSPASHTDVVANLAGDQATVRTYKLVSVKDSIGAEASADALRGSATITVNPGVTAKVEGSVTIAALHQVTTNVTVKLTGVAPWKVTWTDGSTSVTSDYTSSPGVFPVTLTNLPVDQVTKVTYKVTAVKDGTSAEAIAGEGEAVITVVPPATATLPTETKVVQPGSPVALQVALTGIGPWQVTWSDDVSETYSSATATRSVTLTNAVGCAGTTNVYTIKALKDANGDASAADLKGTVTVLLRNWADPAFVAGFPKIQAGKLVLEWTGKDSILQSSGTLPGVWADVAGTVSTADGGSYSVDYLAESGDGAKFYRLVHRCE